MVIAPIGVRFAWEDSTFEFFLVMAAVREKVKEFVKCSSRSESEVSNID